MTSRALSRDRLLNALREFAEKPAAAAQAMPPELYLSEDIHTLERERIFAKDWLCAGRADEILNPGDYLTDEIGGQPVFIIRQRDGGIKAFANVCRHRMMMLLEGTGTCRRIVCPYHAWSYDLDGHLLGAPHMKNSAGFKKTEHGLREIHTTLWQGWIYLTLNDNPVPLDELLAPLAKVTGRYHMSDYIHVLRQDHVWDTNWKVLTDNFMESYHLPIAHRRTVGAWMSVTGTKFPKKSFPAFTYQTFSKTGTARYGTAHPDNKHLRGRWRQASVMPSIFPCHMYVLAPDHLWYLSLRPKGAAQVKVRFGVALAPEVMAARKDGDGLIEELSEFFDRVNAEDRFLVEAIFKNLRSPLARPGPLCWLERELHDFQKYLARRLANPG